MVSLPKLHVAVLMGGWANERPVSLMSGNGVADALESRGHRVTRIDMDREVAQRLHDCRPDVVFNALHGVPGEDGTVQGMMDLMGIPYTHSGLQTSVIAIDKELTKHALVPHGIPMPGGRIVRSDDLYESDPLARPYVLKPVNEGSSVGVAIVSESHVVIHTWPELGYAAVDAFTCGEQRNPEDAVPVLRAGMEHAAQQL